MKKYILALLGAIFIIAYLMVTANNCHAKIPDFSSNPNNSQGYEFYLAIPPNESASYPLFGGYIKLYISAAEQTKVDIYYGNMFEETITVQPYSIYTYDVSAIAEVRTIQKPVHQAFRLVAKDKPISVYVLNSKQTTSDGYMAIPTKAWGKRYVHNSFWEKYEGFDNGTPYFKSGFIIIANENVTNVQIRLKSTDDEIYRDSSGTDGGSVIGEVLNYTLYSGQVLRIATKGETDGLVDLSGSSIESDKPIGVIAYHERTCIPSDRGFSIYSRESRNCLSEMLFPVSSWGKEFYTLEFKKKNNYGDYYRIISDEPDNDYTIKYYDLNTGALISGKYGLLPNTGSVAEIPDFNFNIDVMFDNSIKGVGIIRTSKPAQVFQYCYTSMNGRDSSYDPFMVTIPPREQFVKQTIFQIPGLNFTTSRFNILAVGDTNDAAKNQAMLSSIEINTALNSAGQRDFQSLEKHLGKSPFTFRIPQTNIYWAIIDLNPGSYAIRSKTPFAGTIYGMGREDGYGWPAATAGANLYEIDSLAPVLTRTGNCGLFVYSFYDTTNGKPTNTSWQLDLGVEEAPELLPVSYNFALKLPNSPFPASPPLHYYNFQVEVIDRSIDAYAEVSVKDVAGNQRIDTIFYTAEKPDITPSNKIDFGKIVENTSKSLNTRITNVGKQTVQIDRVYLKTNTVFRITAGQIIVSDAPATLQASYFHDVVIKYAPVKESTLDLDSLIIITHCGLRLALPVRGNTNKSKINVGDFIAGEIKVGSTKYSTNELFIENPGSDTLIVYSYKMQYKDRYFYDSIANFTTPFNVLPGRRVVLKYGVFKPEVLGDFYTNVVFSSNAVLGDSISGWTGSAVSIGPEIVNCDWKRRRVLTQNDSSIYILNNGAKDVTIESVNFENGKLISDDANFEILKDISGNLIPATGPLFDEQRKAYIPVRYLPNSEFDHTANIVVKFKNTSDVLVSNLSGYGYLPKIEFSGYTFTKTLDLNSNESASANSGEVFIKSNSLSSELTVKAATLLPNLGNPADFSIKYGGVDLFTSPYSNVLAIPGAGNDKVDFDVVFKPLAAEKRVAAIEILHDAVPGNKDLPWNYKLDTMYIVGFAKDPSVKANSLDFGDLLACKDSVMIYTIENQSSSAPLIIDSIYLESLQNVFIIQDPVVNIYVDSKSAKSFIIKFTPSSEPGLDIFNTKIIAKTRYSVSGDTITLENTLHGASHRNTLEIRLPSIGDIVAGEKTRDAKSFPVYIKNLNPEEKWENYDVNTLVVKIAYESSRMKYDGPENIIPGQALSGWTLTAKEELISSVKAVLTISGAGSSIKADGELFSPIFTTLLSDKPSFTYDVDFAEVNTSACLNINKIPGEIKFSACVQNLRNVKFSNSEYELKAITPAPVNTASFDVDFSVGLDNSFTTIELCSYTGEILKVLTSGEMKSGAYRITIDSGDLSSGVYYIKMKSGPFEKKEKIVVER